MKVLLHLCCAPCSTESLDRLRNENMEVIGFFYNPNIHPEEEYKRRKDEVERYCREVGMDVIYGPYDVERWFGNVAGLEDEPEKGGRCAVCFRMRLETTAALAKKRGFDAFTTTLTISPHKDSRVINAIGSEIGSEQGIPFLLRDFKKKDGFKKSLVRSKMYGLRRQDYCGCIYSRR